VGVIRNFILVGDVYSETCRLLGSDIQQNRRYQQGGCLVDSKAGGTCRVNGEYFDKMNLSAHTTLNYLRD
jgi:hypothetical protein